MVILTGAGASKWLGKETTFGIYAAPEFQGLNYYILLTEIREFLSRKSQRDLVDLEQLLDYINTVLEDFDKLYAEPHFQGPLSNAKTIRGNFEDAREEVLDFMVTYYGKIEEAKAQELYEPFLSGISDLIARDRKHHAITLFTLNYDEAIEGAILNTPRYNLFDGFLPGYRSFWESENFDKVTAAPNSPIPIALFKLHGSVSWTRATGSDRVERTLAVPRGTAGRNHVLLYPTQAAKQTQVEPFKTAYAYLDQSLMRCKIAVFIGTSFRDKEILESLHSAFSIRPNCF